jgi:hypothetical protein
MALSKKMVAGVIDIIKQDPGCRRVINKSDMPRLLQMAPAWLGSAGALRNAGMQTYEWWNEIPPVTSEDSGSAYFMERICQGVADAVALAFQAASKKKMIPGINMGAGLVKDRNETFFGHYANVLETTNGREYILDWWMTLEIDNPMVWQRHEWNHYPIVHAGIPFKMFDEFP